MDYFTCYCPNEHCLFYGVPFNQGYLVWKGSSGGDRQRLCQHCHTTASLRRGTAYARVEVEERIFTIALRALAEGNSLVVGKRCQENADLLINRLNAVRCGFIPFFTSDQLPEYLHALLKGYGTPEVLIDLPGKRGRKPKPKLLPPATLHYAQIVKHRRNGRVVDVTTRILCGDETAIQACLQASAVSQTINTSFVERNNLTCRQCNGRLSRKVLSFSKELSWMEKHLGRTFADYHFVLPHASLAQLLPPPQPTRGKGSPKKWQPVTPAMAAGLTDHVWPREELLSYRVPPPFLAHWQVGGSSDRRDPIHHGC